MRAKLANAGTVRPGFSFVELQVALVLFGIALAGLGPLVIMHLRQIRAMEDRFSDGDIYYVVPAADRWARKLGAAAAVQQTDPGPAPPPVAPGVAYEVSIVSVAEAVATETITAHVSLRALGP